MWAAWRTERRLRLGVAAALAMGVIQLPACALLRPRTPAPAAASLGAAETSQLLTALADRGRILKSLRTAAVMEYASPQHHVKAREEIVVRRPDSLRVVAMSPFGVAAVVAARGTELEIFEPGKDTLLRGAATARTLNRFANIPLKPAAAVNLLLGLAPPSAVLSAAPAGVAPENAMTVVSYALSGGGALDLGFSGGQLAMVRERAADGQIDYEVHYRDYRDIGGTMFAYVLEAEFPRAGTRVSFHFERPIINGSTPGSLFVLTPGPNTRELLLSRAGAPSRVLARWAGG